jgi:hypothetical protein
MIVKRFVAPVVVGLVVAVAFGVLGFVTRHTATPDVVEGWATPNVDGTAIWLYASESLAEGDGYVIAGAPWKGTDNTWHLAGGRGPTCVGTDTSEATHVRVGIVEVEAGEGLGGPHVVWLQCLE